MIDSVSAMVFNQQAASIKQPLPSQTTR